jgi:tetratricopeptide (TPR) repeat protein
MAVATFVWDRGVSISGMSALKNAYDNGNNFEFEKIRMALSLTVWNFDFSALKEFYDSKAVVSQTLEDVTVKISQSKDFEGANLFALKLLEYRPSSHQAYYIKSVYLESKGDISAARDEMLKALTIDRYNSVYLLGMSIYEYKLGNQMKAEQYLSETIAINPNQQGVDIVSKLISGSKK